MFRQLGDFISKGWEFVLGLWLAICFVLRIGESPFNDLAKGSRRGFQTKIASLRERRFVHSRFPVNLMLACGMACLLLQATASPQDDPNGKYLGAAHSAKKVTLPPAKVDVQPVAPDTGIQDRLNRILSATGWFENPRVEVRNGVVFLTG